MKDKLEKAYKLLSIFTIAFILLGFIFSLILPENKFLSDFFHVAYLGSSFLMVIVIIIKR